MNGYGEEANIPRSNTPFALSLTLNLAILEFWVWGVNLTGDSSSHHVRGQHSTNETQAMFLHQGKSLYFQQRYHSLVWLLLAPTNSCRPKYEINYLINKSV